MKYLTHWSTALITLAVISLLGWSDPYLKETARLKSFDLIQQYDTPQKSNNVVIVEIDEKTIEKNGQWPWSREVIGNLVWDLADAGANAIILPILFSEEDRFKQDEFLAGALVSNKTVIAQTGTTQTNKNAVPRGVAKIGDPMPWLYEWPGMLGPIPVLGVNAGGVGVINTAPEIDGVVRRIPLIVKVGDETYPSMAMETIRVLSGDPSYQVKTQQGGITAMRIPSFKTIDTDPFGRIWLRWNKEFDTISASKTIEDFGKVVGGKVVIVALTAEGLNNVIATPKGEAYSHIPIATSLQTVINGENIVRTPEATFLEFVTAVAVSLLLILVATRLPYWVTGLTIVAIPVVVIYLSYYYFINKLQLWDASWIIFVSTIVGFHSVFNRFVVEFFEKQRIKKQFEGYASPAVVKILQEDPDIIKNGVKREISICFSDLRGFTNLGEAYGDDVKGLTEIMNGYMDAITQPVLDNNGMIIKYIGDASMHVHNAPVDDPDHAFTAVQTGLQMLKAVEDFNLTLAEKGIAEVGMGAGINTGYGYLGEMGSSKRHSYDVLGDAVSTTARLESQCKNYGVLLIVGPETMQRTKDCFFYLKLDDLAVKGKSVGLDIYTVLPVGSEGPSPAYESARERHNEMLKMYRNQEFKKAITVCQSLKGEFHNKMNDYYNMWMERCEFMSNANLPKDWDGIFRATTK